MNRDISFTRKRSTLIFTELIVFCLVIYAAYSTAQSVASDENAPSDIRLLTRELPRCSVLYEQLEQGDQHKTKEDAYMDAMRILGIKRAILQVTGIWQNKKTRELKIVSSGYFAHYDDSGSQITDPQHIQEIQVSAQAAVINKAALDRASSAGYVHGIDRGVYPRNGQRVYAIIDLLDSPYLRELWPRFFPLVGAAESALNRAALSGDLVSVQNLIYQDRPSAEHLDEALNWASSSRYDNSAVIEILIRAGADVNAHSRNGTTALISSLRNPCNVQTLLQYHAKLDEKDRWGNTALKIAKDSGFVKSAQLLERASKFELKY